MAAPRIALSLAAAACAALAAAPAAHAETTPALDRELARTGAGGTVAVIAVLESQVDPSAHPDAEALLRALRREAARTQPAVARAADVSGTRRFWLVNAMALRATPAQARELASTPGVERVELDRPVRIAGGGVRASSFPAAGGAWGLAAVGAPALWARAGVNGAGIRIGSIDTGVDASHPALAGRVAAWRDFVAGRPQPYDDNGHGTHTIGTMVGGSVGMAPGASVVVARAMGADGLASGSTLLAAAQWMTDPDGNPATADQPQVVNNSWGTQVRSDGWFRPMVRQWLALGIVPVFAAGNTGPGPSTIGSPADYPESLAVGSIGAGGSVSQFSARGPVVWTDPDGTGPAAGTLLAKPDLVAPGEGIVSTVPGGGYAAYSGTSMAAPHAAGAVALLRQAAPSAAPAAVMEALRAGAADRGPAGPDPDYGRGLLDLPAAFTVLTGGPVPAAAAPPATTPAPQRRAARRVGRRAPVRMTAAQMRTSRRIARVAARRVMALERRLAGRAAPWPLLRSRARVTLRRSEMLTTRRIARGAIRRAARLETRLLGGPRSAVARLPRAPKRLSPAQLRLTDRMARAALRRVRALERLAAQR